MERYNEYQLSDWVIITNGDGDVDGSTLPMDSQPKSIDLV